MTILLRCQACQKPLKVKEELAGKKVKCPSCGQSVPVPLPEVEAEPEEELVAAEMDEGVTAAPKGKPAKAATSEGKPAGTSKWVPCPKCGTPDPKRVKFTFWGSVYGPKLFNHVRCLQCGATYNGKTGGSNLIPAIGCVALPAIGIVLILAALGVFIWYKTVYLPDKEEEDLKRNRRGQAIVREYTPLVSYGAVKPTS